MSIVPILLVGLVGVAVAMSSRKPVERQGPPPTDKWPKPSYCNFTTEDATKAIKELPADLQQAVATTILTTNPADPKIDTLIKMLDEKGYKRMATILACSAAEARGAKLPG